MFAMNSILMEGLFGSLGNGSPFCVGGLASGIHTNGSSQSSCGVTTEQIAQINTLVGRLGLQTVGNADVPVNAVSTALSNGNTSLLSEAQALEVRVGILENNTRQATFSVEYENYALTNPGWSLPVPAVTNPVTTTLSPITPPFIISTFLQSTPTTTRLAPFRTVAALASKSPPQYIRGDVDRYLPASNLTTLRGAYTLDNSVNNAMRAQVSGLYSFSLTAVAQLTATPNGINNFIVAHVVLLPGIGLDDQPADVNSFITPTSPAQVVRGSVAFTQLQATKPVGTITTDFEVYLSKGDAISLPRFSAVSASSVSSITSITPAWNTVDAGGNPVSCYTDGNFTIAQCTFTARFAPSYYTADTTQAPV